VRYAMRPLLAIALLLCAVPANADARVYLNGWWLCADTMTFREDCAVQLPQPPTGLTVVVQ